MADEKSNGKISKDLNVNLLAAHVSIDAPHYKNSRFYNFPKTFGKMFPAEVTHADHPLPHLSALSPAAYFVDLVRLLDDHHPSHSGGWVPVGTDERGPTELNQIKSLQHSTDGNVLVAQTGDGIYRCTNASEQNPRRLQFEKVVDNKEAQALAMLNEQTIIVDGEVLDLESGQPQPKANLADVHSDAVVRSLLAAPDGQIVYAGTNFGLLYRYNAAGDEWHGIYDGWPGGNTENVKALAMTADGQTLIVGTQEYGIRYYDVRGDTAGDPVNHRGHHLNNIKTLIVMPDDETVLAGTQQGLFYWKLADVSVKPSPANEGLGDDAQKNVTSLIMAPDDTTLYAGTEGGVFTCRFQGGLFSPWQLLSEGSEDDEQNKVTALAVSANGRSLYAGTEGAGIFHRKISGKGLRDRRPDLWQLPLDQAHTKELVPFLDIVNNVMRAHLGREEANKISGGETSDDGSSEGEEPTVEAQQRRLKLAARKELAEAWHPFNLPLNMPLQEISSYLAHFGLSLSDIYETFQLSESNDARVAAPLGLSPQELRRLATADAKPESLNKIFGLEGIKDNNDLGGLDQVATFLKQTGLAPDELMELMHVDGLDLVREMDGEKPLEPQRISDLTLQKLDTLNHLIRLSRRLDYSFSDLDLALRATGLQPVQRVPLLVTGSEEGLRIWDAVSGSEIPDLLDYEGTVLSAAFSQDGTKLVTGGENTAHIWDLEERRLIKQLDIKGHITSIAFHPDSTKFVTGSWHSYDTWDAASGDHLHALDSWSERFEVKVAFNHDGSLIATTGHGSGHISIWDAADGTVVKQIEQEPTALCVAFRPNFEDTQIVTGAEKGIVLLWDVDSEEEVALFMGDEKVVVSSVAFSPDGTQIVTNNEENLAITWDVPDALKGEIADGVATQGFDNEAGVESAAFSPDGKRILTVGHGKVRIWDAVSPDRMMSILEDEGSVNCAVFGPVPDNDWSGPLSRLAQVEVLSEKLDVPVDVLCSFISDMNTTAGFSASHKPAAKSLFDRVFNTPPFYQRAGKNGAAPLYHPWETTPLTWNSLPTPGWASGLPQAMQSQIAWLQQKDVTDFAGLIDLIKAGKMEDAETALDKNMAGVDRRKAFALQPRIRSSLQAALEVDNDELQAIVNHLTGEGLIENPTKIVLDLPMLTRLYRFAKMAHLLKMKVPDYLLLLKILKGEGEQRLGAAEITSLDDVATIMHWAGWLQETGMSSYQLAFLIGAEVSDAAKAQIYPIFGELDAAKLRGDIEKKLGPALLKPHTLNRDVEAQTLAITQHLAEFFDQDAAVVKSAINYLTFGQRGVTGLLSNKGQGLQDLALLLNLAQSFDLSAGALEALFENLVLLRTTPKPVKNVPEPTADQLAETWFTALDELVRFSAFSDWSVRNNGQNNWGITLRSWEEDDVWQDPTALVVGTGQGGVFDIALATESGALFAAAEEGLLRSADEGLTWDSVDKGLEDETVISIDLTPDGQTLFAGTESGNLYRGTSEIGKETRFIWQQIGKNFLGSMPIERLAATADGGTLYGIAGKQLFRGSAKDDGWPDAEWKRLVAKEVRGPIYDLALDDGSLYVTTKEEVFYSDDDGDNWESSDVVTVKGTTLLPRGFELEEEWWTSWGSAVLVKKLRDMSRLSGTPDGRMLFAVHGLPGELHRYSIAEEVFEAYKDGEDYWLYGRKRKNIHLDLGTLETVQAFGQLSESFAAQRGREEGTAGMLADALLAPEGGGLPALSGWEASQIAALSNYLFPNSKQGGDGRDTPARVAGLVLMKRCFDQAARLGVDVQLLIDLCRLDDEGTTFDDASEAAHNLLSAVKSKYADDDWQEKFGPIRDHLNEVERDGLAALLLRQMRREHPDRRFETLQDLSGYLLIDVEMSGCADTSYVKEAIGCLQIYIERSRLHLEEGVTLSPEIPDSVWAWMGHYRLWEANRKVFFYPENYLEPDLRRGATPLFNELQSELQQGEIDDEAVTNAYINYFDKLDELAALTIADAHMATVTNPLTGKEEETLFLIGRTSSDPPVHYVRRALLDQETQQFTAWRPWEKIDLTIPTGSVAAVYMLNRLYLYWTEQKTKKVKPNQNNDPVVTTTATVKYSYQKVSGRWLQPQTHATDPEIKVERNDKFKEILLVVPSARPANSRPLHTLTVQYKEQAEHPAEGTFSIGRPCAQWFSEYIAKKGLGSGSKLKDVIERTKPADATLVVGSGWQNMPDLKVWGRALTVAPDGRTLFASTFSNTYQLAPEGSSEPAWQELSNPKKKTGPKKLIMTPDGRLLFLGTWGEGVFVRKIDGTKKTEWLDLGLNANNLLGNDYDLSGTYVNDLVLSPNCDAIFVTIDKGGVFRCSLPVDVSDQLESWHQSGPQWDRVSQKPLAVAFSLVVTPDGGTLFTSVGGSRVWHTSIVKGGKSDKWHQEDLPYGSFEALAITPDGRTLFTAAHSKLYYRQLDDGASTVWQTVSAQVLVSNKADQKEEWSDAEIICFVTTPDSRTLFAGTTDKGVIRFNLADDRWLLDRNWYRSTHPDHSYQKKTTALAVSPDGGTLFASTENDTENDNVYALPLRPSLLSDDDGSFYVVDRPPRLPDPDSNGEGQSQAVDQTANNAWVSTQRLATHAVHPLRERLVTGGLDALLSLESQFTAETPLFADLQPDNDIRLPKNSGEFNHLDFASDNPYAIYYREIFFHIPFLIADALQRNRQFEHARKWYQYILDPTKPGNGSGQPAEDEGMWRFRPFRNHTKDKLAAMLFDKANQADLIRDAFNPDAIAATRPGAYEKALAMKYLDNLLDWGDMLFAQDNWEAINQATLLYVRTLNLLGPKPRLQKIADPAAQRTMTAHGLIKGKEWHAPSADLAQILPSSGGEYEDPFFDVPSYFTLPENDLFASYWDRAQDRLYKIRHCMNISGVVRQLALFQPPIDPRQIMRALAAGLDISSAAALLTATVPHYRFATMIRVAKSMTAMVSQLGTALLSALEKKDVEDLNRLHTTQEQVMLKMTQAIKEEQIKEADGHLQALQHSLDSAQYRHDHYNGLISGDMSTGEQVNLALMIDALEFHTASIVLHLLAGPGYLAPNIFGFSDGGMDFGRAIEIASEVAESTSSVLSQSAQIAATTAQYARRGEDWTLQRALASFDVDQIGAEIAGAESRQTILQRDLENHEKSIEQAQEREEFFRRKFSNKELYQWMAGRLSTIYYQSYQLAYELALSAERAYQYERHSDRKFIDFGLWDSQRKGLMAGEGLMLALNQLEKAHLDGNVRELEIEKTISLRQTDPKQLLTLIREGTCSFELHERDFDYDFPGHYCRRIKSLSISIPAVVGPYENIHATLIQKTDRVLMEANPTAVVALISGEGLEKAKPGVVRSSWRPFQQIAISKGLDDNGMFQLNFQDERYLPFEGTGALSSWELNMPKGANRNLDYDSISDVIITLRYTALDAGASKLREEVLKQLENFSGRHLFSLRQASSSDWGGFVNQSPDDWSGDAKPALPFNLTADRLARGGDVTLDDDDNAVVFVQAHWRGKVPSGSFTVMLGEQEVTLNMVKDKPFASATLKPKADLPQDWTVTLIDEGDIKKLEGLADIVLVVPYKVTLDWSLYSH